MQFVDVRGKGNFMQVVNIFVAVCTQNISGEQFIAPRQVPIPGTSLVPFS